MGQLALMNPVTPVSCPGSLTVQPWRYIPSPALKAFLDQAQAQATTACIPTLYYATQIPGRTRILFFFPGSKIRKITTMKHQVGCLPVFLKVKGQNQLVALPQSPREERGKSPIKRYLQNSSLSHRYQSSFTELVGQNFLEKEIIPICSSHKGIA